VGFVDGSPRTPGFWAEREAARFLERSLVSASAQTSGPGAHGVARRTERKADRR